jgi:hypothetical protein
VPVTVTTPGLSSPEAEIPDDFVLDWPHLEDAEIPEDLVLAWPDLEDAELADWDPPDPGLPEAGVREVLKAGRWDRARGDGGGFAAGGVADHLPPGSVLAGFAGDAWATGLGRLSDDELIGVMRAARRLASWSAAMELAAVGDLWRRRVAEEQAGDTGAACHADDEIAAALTLTGRAADRVLDLAIALRRLPLTSQALAAGDIDLPRAMVIADEVTGLDDEHSAAVEHAVAGSAPGQTTGQLRAAARRAVLAVDPSAARQPKERAQQDARVERWNEHAGTAALAGRDLPPASVLVADQNVTALARQLKAAGVPGTMDTLRAEAFLALLSGTPTSSLLPGGLSMPREPANDSGSAGPVIRGDSAAAAFPLELPRDLARPAFPPPGATVKLPPGLSGTIHQSPGLSGTVNLTMPLATWLDLSDEPGNASGTGRWTRVTPAIWPTPSPPALTADGASRSQTPEADRSPTVAPRTARRTIAAMVTARAREAEPDPVPDPMPTAPVRAGPLPSRCFLAVPAITPGSQRRTSRPCAAAPGRDPTWHLRLPGVQARGCAVRQGSHRAL